MKKITTKILAALMAVLMLAAVVGCAPAEPVAYDTGAGLVITMDAGMEEFEVEGMTKAYVDNKVLFTCVKETNDELAAVGFENISLEEYAELSQLAYGLETPYAADANGNLVTTYNADVDGQSWFYYVTLREGTDGFWTITLACADSDKAVYADKFATWNASIVVD